MLVLFPAAFAAAAIGPVAAGPVTEQDAGAQAVEQVMRFVVRSRADGTLFQRQGVTYGLWRDAEGWRIFLSATHGPSTALRLLLFCFALALPGALRAQTASPHAIDIPSWFSETFPDFREDVRDATKQGKRLMIYFGQDGCPYCKALMQTNFSQPRIVEKTRRSFVALALNIWGDRKVTGFDGKPASEKEFARAERVQFTPTVLFLDEKGDIVARLNGYYPPHRFEAALDYVAGRLEMNETFASYMSRATKDAASETLHEELFFMQPPYDLRRSPGAKPLAVVFETPYCSGCDELHKEAFVRTEVKAELGRFDVARFALGETTPLVTPQGRRVRSDEWARALNIVVHAEHRVLRSGREVFRTEAYLRPFHVAGAFAYISSGAYRKEPSFQRFLQARADRMHRGGPRGGSLEMRTMGPGGRSADRLWR
jgi:thioredoxin-related protein